MSSAVLATDLARHPYGSRVADVLDRVLALSPQEAAALPAAAGEGVRRRVLDAAGTARVGPALSDLAAAVDAGAALAGLATRLEESLLGTLEDLHAMVLREAPVAQLPSYARQVVCDALSAAWAGPEADLRDVLALAAPWEAALDPVPAALPERTWTPAVRGLLEQVPRRTPEQWTASVRARRGAPRSAWSEAMHAACDAAWRADRLHDVARAQLAAARVLSLTHTGVPQGAAAMVVTASVQALCTADLVPDAVVETLQAAWEAGEPPR